MVVASGVTTPTVTRHIASVLRLLGASGFSGPDAVRAAYHFNELVTELAADAAGLATAPAALGSSP